MIDFDPAYPYGVNSERFYDLRGARIQFIEFNKDVTCLEQSLFCHLRIASCTSNLCNDLQGLGALHF